MKKTFRKQHSFLGLMLLLFLGSTNLQAQVLPDLLVGLNTPPELHYDVTIEERVLIPSTVNITDVSPYDYPKLRTKKITKHFHQFVDDNDDPSTEISFSDNENYFHKWTTPPSKIAFNGSGTTSYYTTSNGEEAKFSPYSELQQGFYDAQKEEQISSRFLGAFKFSAPNQADIQELIEAGFEVTVTPIGDNDTEESETNNSNTNTESTNINNTVTSNTTSKTIKSLGGLIPSIGMGNSSGIDDGNTNTSGGGNTSGSEQKYLTVATSPDMKVEWDSESNTITMTAYEDGIEVEHRVSLYGNNSLGSNSNLLSEQIISSRLNLKKGVCARNVLKSTYSNYSNRTNTQVAFGRSIEEEDNSITDNNFRIFPNPVSGNKLNLVLPKSFIDQEFTIVITSINGRQIRKFNGTSESSEYRIHIKNILANDGFYILTLNNGQQSISERFYFMNY